MKKFDNHDLYITKGLDFYRSKLAEATIKNITLEFNERMFNDFSIENAHEFMYDNNYAILRRDTLNKPKKQITHSNGFSFGSVGGTLVDAFSKLILSCSYGNCCSSDVIKY